MKLGTTPRHTFYLPFEISLLKELKITYVQAGKIVLEKYLADCKVESNSVSYLLSQAETFLFKSGTCVELQVRILTLEGDVLASNICTVLPERCLDEEVLE